MTACSPCTCDQCVEMKKFFSIIDKLPDEDKQWMEKFYENLDGERLDSNYNQAILDGSWPSAVDQLEDALNRAKERRI